jgi:hypothetical protein
VLGRHLDRLVEVGAIDDVEASDELLGLGVRAVGDDDLAAADPYLRPPRDPVQPIAEHADAAAVHLLDPGLDVLAGPTGRLNGLLFDADHPQVLHALPPRLIVSPGRRTAGYGFDALAYALGQAACDRGAQVGRAFRPWTRKFPTIRDVLYHP